MIFSSWDQVKCWWCQGWHYCFPVKWLTWLSVRCFATGKGSTSDYIIATLLICNLLLSSKWNGWFKREDTYITQIHNYT